MFPKLLIIIEMFLKLLIILVCLIPYIILDWLSIICLLDDNQIVIILAGLLCAYTVWLLTFKIFILSCLFPISCLEIFYGAIFTRDLVICLGLATELVLIIGVISCYSYKIEKQKQESQFVATYLSINKIEEEV